MNDGSNVFLLENAFQPFAVQHVNLIEARTLARDRFDAVERFGLGIAQIVEYGHVISCIDEFNARVAADKSGAAAYQNGFHSTPNVGFALRSVAHLS